ncbi:probable 39S ribosomal protein L23, mitochondrial [Schistocerca cancellata]|uniref:probable 39S ribosomal protein L23, mitochondrial n=1 Tax=Schistocerca cancellata TaxID=274614 RepID=UPI002118BFBA|nr:probable 39S ribosomal protein L23, mitochondrial [Schistocerca cancellata]
MSTRWYPLYQRGNPQLRIFLPNFWLKLVRPSVSQPPNVVEFIVSTEMTRIDIKNYLEKIYNVPVVNVRTRIAMGKTHQDKLKGYITKDDDYKVAYVTLPREHAFKFPDIFPKMDREEKDKKSLEEAKEGYKKYIERSKDRPGAPGWFSF